MSGNFTEITHVKKRRFLNAFAETGTIRGASKVADVTWPMHYHWLKEDPEYVAAFAEAKIMAGDMLEGVAIERAKKKSDLLLIFLLKGMMPEKYKDRQEISGVNGQPLTVKLLSGVSMDDL